MEMILEIIPGYWNLDERNFIFRLDFFFFIFIRLYIMVYYIYRNISKLIAILEKIYLIFLALLAM